MPRGANWFVPDEFSPRGGGPAWWGAAFVTGLNALTSAGFAVAGLLAQLPGRNDLTRVFAMYAAARSLPLAAAILWLIGVRSTRGLGTLAVVVGLIQTCDALIGLIQNDLGKTIGPVVLAIATVAGVPSLFRGTPRTQRLSRS